MKKLLITTLAVLLLASFAVADTGDKKASGESHAIIVAIEFYSSGWAWRPDAYKDANKVAWILSNNGFQIHRLYGRQATSENIMETIDDVVRKTEDGGHILFYFSGHGLHPKSDPSGDYLVPFGAEPNQDEDLINVATIKKEVIDYMPEESALFVFDTGSTLTSPDGQLGTIQEFATALRNGLSGTADNNKNGKVEFSELAKYIGPKVKEAKVVKRPTDEIYITEDMITVVSTKIKKKARKRRRPEVEHYRPDQFDQIFEMRMEEKMRQMEDIQQQLEEMEEMMQDPRRLPLPK